AIELTGGQSRPYGIRTRNLSISLEVCTLLPLGTDTRVRPSESRPAHLEEIPRPPVRTRESHKPVLVDAEGIEPSSRGMNPVLYHLSHARVCMLPPLGAHEPATAGIFQ